MKEAYKALVYSNVWVGLAVASLCYITMEMFYTVNYDFLLFIAAATVFAYNYMRLVQLRAYSLSGDSSLKTWARQHRPLVWIYTIFFGALAVYLFLQIYRWQLLVLLAFPAIVSVLYPLSFKNAFSGFTSLRAVPGLKLFLISLTWAYVTVLVPAGMYYGLGAELTTEFVMRSVLITGLIIPFDIRDIKQDDQELQTIPQQLGVEKAKQLAMFFIALYQFWLLFRYFYFDYSIVSTAALILGFEAGTWLIKKSSPSRGDAYFSFWLEGVPIFAVVLLLLGHWLF